MTLTGHVTNSLRQFYNRANTIEQPLGDRTRNGSDGTVTVAPFVPSVLRAVKESRPVTQIQKGRFGSSETMRLVRRRAQHAARWPNCIVTVDRVIFKGFEAILKRCERRDREFPGHQQAKSLLHCTVKVL